MATPPSLIDSLPFAKRCGITIDDAAAERVVGRVSWTADGCTSGGVLHGGLVMTLADTTGAVCAFLNLPEGASTTTIESKTNFLRAIREGSCAVAESVPLHVGRTTILVETKVRDDDGKLVAATTQTQAVLAPRAR